VAAGVPTGSAGCWLSIMASPAVRVVSVVRSEHSHWAGAKQGEAALHAMGFAELMCVFCCLAGRCGRTGDGDSSEN
jgi:hypothetical protein